MSTVYVNDRPIGNTEVYHARADHATDKRRFKDRYIREMTPTEARDEGFRPCKVCFPDESGEHCPGCGFDGDGDEVLAGDQVWCSNEDCRVVSFNAGGGTA